MNQKNGCLLIKWPTFYGSYSFCHVKSTYSWNSPTHGAKHAVPFIQISHKFRSTWTYIIFNTTALQMIITNISSLITHTYIS